MIVGCCLLGVLGQRMMREGLRGPEQLRIISKHSVQAYRQSSTIIWVDKIIFEGILVVVLVWVRWSYSARHHGGHVVWMYWWSLGTCSPCRRV